MISKEVASKVLSKCLITGGDFAEIFEEDTISNSIGIIDNKVENALGGRSYGIGIRIFKGLKSVYAYTNDNSISSLLDTAYKAALALGNLNEEKTIVLNN
ncbi:MAG: PmbA/TldA family metallopeptidase, partial [Paraclostridium sp.]